ncbi:MAG: ROK family protein [Fibrobacteria bacterium]|nr:ROK family protein [Fibrobacteria bacterium]
MKNKMILAIDIGAGRGTKIGFFQTSDKLLAETTMPTSKYGKSSKTYTKNLALAVDKLKQDEKINAKIKAIGISCPGIFFSDGSFQLVQNIPNFKGFNLKKALGEKFGCIAAIENDANAGGLAEWSVLRMEVIYWVLGGGWGGAWISEKGSVRYPTVDWDKNDFSLHYTSEPGYAISLDKLMLSNVFSEVGASYKLFERNLERENGNAKTALTGPGGDPNTLRAEVILSGPGRCRLFRTIVADDDFYERFLQMNETKQMSDPAVAGQHISKLSGMRVEAAVNTDRLFGKILAYATRVMLKQAIAQGMPPNIPICLGGKPSYALPYFGPSAQRALGKMGFMNYLRPSILDERGGNANLTGAAVLAEKAYQEKNCR